MTFRDVDGRIVKLKKVVEPAHWADNFEHSHWVATGAVKITYPSLKRAYYDLALAGFRKESSDVREKDGQ